MQNLNVTSSTERPQLQKYHSLFKQNGSEFKGMVTQDFQNFKIAFAAKRTKLKNHCFCSFLKNFQRSKKVTIFTDSHQDFSAQPISSRSKVLLRI
jgi:phosphatidylserine decarboxylase